MCESILILSPALYGTTLKIVCQVIAYCKHSNFRGEQTRTSCWIWYIDKMALASFVAFANGMKQVSSYRRSWSSQVAHKITKTCSSLFVQYHFLFCSVEAAVRIKDDFCTIHLLFICVLWDRQMEVFQKYYSCAKGKLSVFTFNLANLILMRRIFYRWKTTASWKCKRNINMMKHVQHEDMDSNKKQRNEFQFGSNQIYS